MAVKIFEGSGLTKAAPGRRTAMWMSIVSGFAERFLIYLVYRFLFFLFLFFDIKLLLRPRD